MFPQTTNPRLRNIQHETLLLRLAWEHNNVIYSRLIYTSVSFGVGSKVCEKCVVGRACQNNDKAEELESRVS